MRFSKWCHQESNRGHKDFQSFALPTELWHHGFRFACAKIIEKKERTKFIKKKLPIFFCFKKNIYLCSQKTESSAVGSALRSGRRGRAFESPLSDKRHNFSKVMPFCFFTTVPHPIVCESYIVPSLGQIH